MKILLTGIDGFIGSFLAQRWQGGPCELTGITRMKRGGRFDFPVVEADLCKGIPLSGSFDAVVHTAARSPSKSAIAEDFLRDNILATKALIDYAVRHRIKKFIYFSSISIYGIPSRSLIDENSPIISPEPYGISKYFCELLLREHRDEISTVSLRLPGVIGKGARTPWLAQVAEKLIKNEKVQIYNPQSLFNNMVYLDDLERFISLLLRDRLTGFEEVTLGAGRPCQVLTAVQNLAASLGSNSELTCLSSSRKSFHISIRKAKAMGYEPRNTVEILRAYAKDLKGE